MKTYGLLGFPLSHSFSKQFFNEKFQNEHIDAEYVNFELPQIENFPALLAGNTDLCGLNVTIPYKEKVMNYLDEVSESAARIGAVNVIRVSRTNKGIHLKGFNSDIIGFKQSIQPLLEGHHLKALILGTGGASKAVHQGLLELGIATQFVSRKPRTGCITYEDITPILLNEYHVIVNCTPCGMFPHEDECPAIPYEHLSASHLLYDLIYNPEQTLFLKLGAQKGAQTKNGLEMLLLQALASWEFWNGKEEL